MLETPGCRVPTCLSRAAAWQRAAPGPAAARRPRHRGGERARAQEVCGGARDGRLRCGGEQLGVATAATPTARLRLRPAILDFFLRAARVPWFALARGFALRGAHGGGVRRAELHPDLGKFSAELVLREHTMQQPAPAQRVAHSNPHQHPA